MRNDTQEPREGARTISCPYCARRYRLPASLIGSGGARIRCPRCSGVFELRIAASPPCASNVAECPGTAFPTDARRAERSRPELERFADQAVATLGAGTVAQLADAHARGRLFAEFGPQLLDAFEVYRRLAGPHADAALFREALQRCCGVDVIGTAAPTAHTA